MEFNRANKRRNCYSVSRIFDKGAHMVDRQFIVAVEGADAIGTFRQRVGSNYADSKSYGEDQGLLYAKRGHPNPSSGPRHRIGKANMMRKQLIVAVEGTAAMEPFWKTIISDYLEKMIRSFTVVDSIEQSPSAGDTELSLVVFYVRGSYSGRLFQRSGWTRDIDIFFQWLSAIPFSGGCSAGAAVAEGLSAALMMFSSNNGSQTQQNADGKRHCILVGASKPYPFPTPVNCPAMQNLGQSGNIEARARTSIRLADAETVAKAFPQCSISLSVICPMKLPKLRAIYKAGKRNPEAADPSVDTSKNPNFLVLISGNFKEACAAFSHTEMESLAPNQSLVEMDMFSGSAVTSNPSVMNHQPISAGNVPVATVNIEPTMVTSVSEPASPHIPTAVLATSLQSAAPISVSEEMVPNNENTKATTPIVSVMTQSLFPISGAAANVRILNGVASAIPAAPAVLTSGQLGVTAMTGFAPFARTVQMDQNSIPASLTSIAPCMSGNSNLCMSQLLSNIQGGTGAGSQSWIGMQQNVLSRMGTGMPSGIGTMMPPGMTQQGPLGVLPLGRNNSAEANMSLSQQQTSSQSSFVKFWEGKLAGQRQGKPEFITRLQGFKSASASETLAANWPPTIEIALFVSNEIMYKIVREHPGKADILVFWAVDRHSLLNQLQESNTGAAILLPSQIMFLFVSDKTFRLVGMLLAHENMEIEPKIPYQQLQAQLLHQLQQRLKEKQPLSLLQQQQQPLQQLPQQQPPNPLKRQHSFPLQQQSKVSRMHLEETPQTQQQQQIPQMQQIDQQQPITEMAVNQECMQGTGSSDLWLSKCSE
ncbi:hypothetical protein HAX54_002836 [Datura stramonium]|uniref:Mediator of RNA polymerase II transcription subunit 25 n=1 Tax=Datura stramonium TaxID=4076 RepID=A0ABS8T5P4_DATST|nr:hypothetical protein [Datura stramonium]